MRAFTSNGKPLMLGFLAESCFASSRSEEICVAVLLHERGHPQQEDTTSKIDDNGLKTDNVHFALAEGEYSMDPCGSGTLSRGNGGTASQ